MGQRCSVSGGFWRGGILLPAALAVLVAALGCGADDERVPATSSTAGTGGVGLQPTGGGGTGGTVVPESCGPHWPDSPTVLCAGEEALLDSCPQQGEWGYGQDGSYVENVPSYETTGDTVVDSVTTIMWQRESFSSDMLSQWGARVYCDELSLAGYDDWRLPTILELVTIADYGRSYPAMDETAFPHSLPNFHWSTTEGFWSYYLRFGPGEVAAGDPVGGWMAVRCVRGCAVRTDFSASPDGLTVHDGATGLQWQREAVSNYQTHLWEAAIRACEELDYAGYSDWRLPSVKELLTIVEFTDTDQPKIDMDAFPDGRDIAYWSSTPYTYKYDELREAWVVDFIRGDNDMREISTDGGVRCVRSAPLSDGP